VTIQPATISPPREVPATIERPRYVDRPAPDRYAGDDVQPPEIIEKMRIAGRIAAQAMRGAATAIKPGMTTDDLDQVVHQFLIDHGAYPSTLGYRGFPKSCCTSVNEVICHGIPDARPLEDGDIVKIDVTAYINGVHGDTCATFFCGEVDEQARLLTERTQEALARAIKAVKPGRQVNVIGRVIESYGVVRDYTGHGVHTTFHSGLVIPHYDEPAYDTVIKPGMTFTIEPMITLGSGDWYMWEDGWTVLTADGSRCAQFEHTLAVTESGAEVLTRP
jgi:methionyl aminopeptidase